MTTTTELTPLLKRLKLGAVLNTLPERVALADYASFLQIILSRSRTQGAARLRILPADHTDR